MSEETVITRVNLEKKLSTFQDLWAPKVVGELNGQYVKLVKFAGEYVWHHHDEQDELFLVLSGTMQLQLENETIEVMPGEFIIVPRGVKHKPVAESICHVMLFEPASTRNTGNVVTDYTIEPGDLDRI
jgi:mannose-6-phosphate isomerase-like protein (cupin superfamily)